MGMKRTLEGRSCVHGGRKGDGVEVVETSTGGNTDRIEKASNINKA